MANDLLQSVYRSHLVLILLFWRRPVLIIFPASWTQIYMRIFNMQYIRIKYFQKKIRIN